MSSNPVQAACNHTTHLFYHVLCPNQSLTARMTTVVLGGLLLIGAIFAAYSAVSKYFSTPSSPKIPEYPEIGEQAIQSSIAILKNHPEVPRDFKVPPIDARIPHIANLHWTIHYKAYEEALKSHQNNNPWEQKEVLQAADALMKTAYTVSCLTLEDLKPFIDKHSKKDEHGNNKMTYAEALTIQCSYQYRTFYYCTNTYHWIRGGEVWDGKDLNYPRGPTPETHAQPFYKEGTIQNSWNQLYNDYCDRVRSYVTEKELCDGDKRHANWTVKDTGIKTFYHTPDTQPT